MATVSRKRRPSTPKQEPVTRPVKTVSSAEKATGWKVPMLFCAGMLVILAVVWGYRKLTENPELQFSQELYEVARLSHIDLEVDEEGRKYKEDLVSAGRGFNSRYMKDNDAIKITRLALDEGRLDAAVTGVQVIRDVDKRNEVIKELVRACMVRCDMLPWGVFAIRNLKDYAYPAAVQLTCDINERWDQCVAAGQNPRLTVPDDFARPAPETATGTGDDSADEPLPEGLVPLPAADAEAGSTQAEQPRP